jgi:hypothetical protein
MDEAKSNDEQPAAHPADNRQTDDSNPMLYCPVCSERLAQSRCKLVCTKCGYFMSCADYY